jgi:exo-beta-1,3-glucanase (GH17 family)
VDETSLGYGYASELLPYTDYVALSAYPYVTVSSSANGNTNPSLFPAGYFEKWIALDNSKPFLFAETGYIAENVLIPSLSLNKTGTPAWQQAYLEMICNLCKSNHAKMLIWFCSKDYDAGDSTLRALGQYSDVFGIWQNIGFKDRTGAVRPSYQSWTKWMALPKVN